MRDAHLGSVWEGTSNIVALDVLRAIQREGALPVWQDHMSGLLDATPWHPNARSNLDQLMARVSGLAQTSADQKDEAQARRVAAALYHLTSAIAMGWEAHQTQNPRRMVLAQCVLQHRLLPRDPLTANAVTHLDVLWSTSAPVGPVGDICIL